jgi:hypothetical protein
MNETLTLALTQAGQALTLAQTLTLISIGRITKENPALTHSRLPASRIVPVPLGPLGETSAVENAKGFGHYRSCFVFLLSWLA